MRSFITILLITVGIVGRAQDRHWLTPDHLTLQYAGSIGYLSAGVGYDIFKDRARTSFHYGHVPKSLGGPLNIFAGKLIFVPHQYKLSRSVVITPFDVGIMLSYHFGEDFRSRWPHYRYPEDYYWWQTSFRLHLVIQPYTIVKAVTGYIELNANELYLLSYFQNLSGLSLDDVIKLGVGCRFHF